MSSKSLLGEDLLADDRAVVVLVEYVLAHDPPFVEDLTQFADVAARRLDDDVVLTRGRAGLADVGAGQRGDLKLLVDDADHLVAGRLRDAVPNVGFGDVVSLLLERGQ